MPSGNLRNLRRDLYIIFMCPRMGRKREKEMTEQLPEAGGVAWTDIITPDGRKISLTSRAMTPAMAYKNLIAAIEEIGVQSKPTPAPAHQPPPPPPLPEDPAPPIPTMGQDLGLLEYPPKAADTNPGDQFQVEVDEYKATAKKIAFWKSGAQYPTFTQNLTSEYAMTKFNELFKGWQPVEDDEHHPINPPLILTIVTSDKANKNGNYYRNLEAVRRA